MQAKRWRGPVFVLLFFLFYGCAQTGVKKTQSAMIVWKSPAFRYADMGFISDNGKTLQVEIYGSGTALMRLKIDQDSVCMSQFQCMSKSRFNQEFLSGNYPADTLANIFRGREIFDGAGMMKKRNGFTQKIEKTGFYRIDYHVFNNQIIFRDTINQIVIKVTKQ
jgi:hypothetical protein